MTKYILVLSSAILLTLLQAKISFATVKNPFLLPPKLSCDEQQSQLIAQLNTWQYQGYLGLLSTKQRVAPIAWLSNQREWLTINDLVVPIPLMPWLITEISSNHILWQTDLPRYCHQKITVNMIFVGK